MTSKEHEARCMALRGGVTESERALIDELARYEAGAPAPAMPSAEQVTREFVVNGTPLSMSVDPKETVEQAIPRVVKAAGMISYLPTRWMVRNDQGEDYNRQARMEHVDCRLWVTLDVAMIGPALPPANPGPLREALARLEWGTAPRHAWGYGCCPACLSLKAEGHKEGCWLSAALASAKGESHDAR